MLKQKNKSKFKLGKLSGVALIAVVLSGAFFIAQARADEFDQQIQALRQQNASNQQISNNLAAQAASYQDAVDKLEAQIDSLRQAIVANQRQSDDLQNQINIQQAELDHQRQVLGENIKTMYLEGQISTLEILAASKDLNEFVDKQQYRNSVQSKIKATVDKITELKLQLEQKQRQIQALIKEQKAQQDQLAGDEHQQYQLLNATSAQKTEYDNLIKENQAKINDLRRQQVLANIKLFGGSAPGIPGGGGYPWGNAYCKWTGNVDGDCFNYDWVFNGYPWDGWGYGYRNCTSWVAYKLALDNKVGFNNLGNAAQWPGNASARGFEVSYGSGARPGDAAVNPNGYYGHVMYVEAATSDGKVVVSDYNRLGDGLYRGPDGGNAGVLNQSSLVFIHF